MKSIRYTTTWLTFIGVSLLGVVVCSSAYWVARQILVENFDQDLMLEFQQIGGVARVWPDGDFYVDIDFDVATQFNINGSRVFQVWNAGVELGEFLQVIDRSPMLEELETALARPVEIVQNTPLFYNLILPDGQSARAVFQRAAAQLASGDGAYELQDKDYPIDIVVARERQSLDESIAILFRWMLIIAALVPVLSFLIVYIVVGMGIAPLKNLAKKMASIQSSDEQIATEAHWPEEVIPLVNNFNKLLSRLEKGMQRERRFTGDLAHEMRTPLAELRLATDVALRANSKERLVTAVTHVNTLSHSIADLVNAMLLLTRIQSDSNDLVLTPLDIVPSFDQQYQRVQARALERGVDIIKKAPKALIVKTDLALLNAIFSNLLSNAVEHAPANTKIAFELEDIGSTFRLCVGNFAPTLERSDLEYLVEPFWRKESSRQSNNHFGLGLAIVNEAVVGLALELTVELREDHYLSIVCQS